MANHRVGEQDTAARELPNLGFNASLLFDTREVIIHIAIRDIVFVQKPLNFLLAWASAEDVQFHTSHWMPWFTDL